MPLSAGTRLGPYEILAPMGAGGMGEVYRARDTRLGREVAIKISKEQFSERFEREARAVAALNHPNICQIYDVGANFLVMELVDGDTLADRISRGPISLHDALVIAQQLAEGLEAAHEKGIVHRDLKPANIKITRDGKLKVLDFGLAKHPEHPSGDVQNSPTVTISPISAGLILGTAPYMSPEQARGKSVDKRTDIWAFGCVLYELLTGKRLFQGADVSEILASIIKDHPDLTAAPADVRPILEKCLRKDPRMRWQDIGDVRIALGERPVELQRQRSYRVPWLLATGAIVAVLALALLLVRRPPREAQVFKLSLLPPPGAVFPLGFLQAVSPDGRRIAFITATFGRRMLWIQNLDSLKAHELPGTDDASDPFWSPDSRFLAFFAGNKLKKMDPEGGPVETICDVTNSSRGGAWSTNGTIVFAPTVSGGLARVSAAGGTPVRLTELDPARQEVSHRYPWFLPDGRHFLYTIVTKEVSSTAIYVGDLDSKTRNVVATASSNAIYTPPGYVLFVRAGVLVSQPFDARSIKISGDPLPIADRVYFAGTNVIGEFSASQTGVLTYISSAGIENVQLTWFDRSGKALGTVGDPGDVRFPSISPDGSTVVVSRRDLQSGFYELWLHDLARGTSSRFTSNSRTSDNPLWSPDGTHVAFRLSSGGISSVYQRAVGGNGQDEPVDESPSFITPTDWSRDGRYIIEQRGGDPKTGNDIWVLPLFGDRKAHSYLNSEFNEGAGKLSPDGHWLAYVSDETKRNEIYVQSFPTPGRKVQVSTDGGGLPVWSSDGKELFFVSPDRKLMAVEVRTGDSFIAGVAKALFSSPNRVGSFAVSKDERFLIPTQIGAAAAPPITVVVNWTAGLKK